MLRIAQRVISELVAHARKDAPVEACGYLAERETIVAEAIPLTNLDGSCEHFTLDPAEQFAALRRMRADGLKLNGVYHSHPSAPARPSLEDIRFANDPNLSYVIVSLSAEVPDIRSFRIQGGHTTEEELIVEQ